MHANHVCGLELGGQLEWDIALYTWPTGGLASHSCSKACVIYKDTHWLGL